ncbi:MAG: FHA domain-containing protein [Actinomycetota bacterium]
MSGSTAMDDFSANVEVGDGAVARWEVGLAVATGEDGHALDLLAALQEELGPEPTSGELVALVRNDPRFNVERADLAVAVGTPDGIRVFVRGRVEVRTETDELIAGPAPMERDLPGPRALWIGGGGPPMAQGHPVLDLRRGVVPGRGVVLHRSVWPTPSADEHSLDGAGASDPVPASAAATAAAAPEVDPTNPGQGASPLARVAVVPPAPPGASEAESAPIPVTSFESVNWGDPVETREPLPVATQQSEDINTRASAEQVMGIRCIRDHFNNPKAGYCQVCGISMVHLTHRLEPGPRPTLGFVVFADGATYAVDRPYLIGRSPKPGLDSGMTPLATQDATQSVSREHGELRLDGWDVLYVDLGSTNGSYLWSPQAQTWTPLRPNEPMMLASGMSISVGRMTFVFQGASKEVGAR